MSWKCSCFLYGPLHGFTHALDPKARLFVEWGETQLWPPRRVLDWRDEWTLPSQVEARRQVEWLVEKLSVLLKHDKMNP